MTLWMEETRWTVNGASKLNCCCLLFSGEGLKQKTSAPCYVWLQDNLLKVLPNFNVSGLAFQFSVILLKLYTTCIKYRFMFLRLVVICLRPDIRHLYIYRLKLSATHLPVSLKT